MEKTNLIEKSRLTSRLYFEGAPVVILSCVVYLNVEDGKTYLNAKSYNFSQKIITKIELKVKCLDPEGVEINTEKIRETDLSVLPYKSFGSEKFFPLENNNSQSVEVSVTEVEYSDESNWIDDGTEKQYVIIDKPQKNNEVLSEKELLLFENLYKNKVAEGNFPKFMSMKMLDFWICTCGQINREDKCVNCEISKTDIFKFSDTEFLQAKLNKIDKVKSEKKERSLIKYKKQHVKSSAKKHRFEKIKEIMRKNKKATIAFIIVVCVIVVATVSVFAQAKSVKFFSNTTISNSKEFLVFDKTLKDMPLKDMQNGDKILEGWYENAELSGEPIIFPYVVKKNVSLYAKWVKGTLGISYEFEREKAYVTNYNGDEDNIVIPETMRGKKVVGVKSNALANSKIRNVEILKNMEQIEDSAFSGKNIESIVVAEDNPNFSSVDGMLFDKNKNKLFSVPRNLLNEKITFEVGLEEISNSAVEGNMNVKEIIISSSVYTVGSYAFSNCKNLTNVMFEGEFVAINEGAFKNSENLKTIKLPKELEEIPSEMFAGCKSLESVTMPSSVSKIGASAFADCTVLQTIFLPKGVTSIEAKTFQNCKSLAIVQNAGSIKSVGESAFENCILLTSIFETYAIKNIGNKAFANCARLTYFELSPTVKGIGAGIIEGCIGLREISVPLLSKSANSLKYYFGNGESPEVLNVEINYSDMKTLERGMLQGIDIASLFMVDANFTAIESYAIDGMKNLFDVYLPVSLTIMENYAINDCENLTFIFFSSKAPACGYRPLAVGNHDYLIVVPRGMLQDYQRAFRDYSSQINEIW